ncbi:hypothetical protein L6452_29324 [Arctium lappa]|uniref:Uncharacterized protein n=1 Tax=Arctium lappa TaxID=4217 RepID=A0ACB8ZGK9_ARCLA|nr:hypothetical protein L6452_29324 [Arctium lappa]
MFTILWEYPDHGLMPKEGVLTCMEMVIMTFNVIVNAPRLQRHKFSPTLDHDTYNALHNNFVSCLALFRGIK